jgi:hypothetical protein
VLDKPAKLAKDKTNGAMTFIITAFSINGLIAILSKTALRITIVYCAEYCVLFNVMLNAVMLNVVILNVMGSTNKFL